MTNREIILAQLNHISTEIMPYAVGFEPLLYKKLTEYYGDEKWEEKKLRRFTYNSFYLDSLVMQPINTIYDNTDSNGKPVYSYAADFAPDIFEVDTFGTIWRMDKKPFHLERPGLLEPTLDGYKFPTVDKFINRVSHLKEKMIKEANENTSDFRIISLGWGIFEHTWCLRGFENALMDMIAEEDFYAELCEKFTDLMIEIIDYTADIPAEAVFLGDDWGDQRGIIMGKERWVKYFKPCYARIYDAIHKQGRKTINHSCGSVVDIYDDLIEIGLDCHESVQPEACGMAPENVKAKWGKNISFWGCLGSQSTLFNGTPEEIRDEMLRLRDLFKNDGGYILAPAKALTDEMDIKQAVSVVETLSTLND